MARGTGDRRRGRRRARGFRERRSGVPAEPWPRWRAHRGAGRRSRSAPRVRRDPRGSEPSSRRLRQTFSRIGPAARLSRTTGSSHFGIRSLPKARIRTQGVSDLGVGEALDDLAGIGGGSRRRRSGSGTAAPPRSGSDARAEGSVGPPAPRARSGSREGYRSSRWPGGCSSRSAASSPRTAPRRVPARHLRGRTGGRPAGKWSSITHWKNGSATTGHWSSMPKRSRRSSRSVSAVTGVTRSTMLLGKATCSAIQSPRSGSTRRAKATKLLRATVPLCGRLSQDRTANGAVPAARFNRND